MIIIRLLDKDDYGTWGLFISISSILEVLRNGFIRNPMVTFMKLNDEHHQDQIVSGALLLNILLSVVISAGLYFSAPLVSSFLNAPKLAALQEVYAITYLVLIPFSHGEYLQQANMKFLGILLAYFTRSLVLVAFLIFIYFQKEMLSLEDLIYVHLVAAALASVISILFAVRYLRMKYTFSTGWLKKLLGYGKYSFGTNLSSMLFQNVDQWMLSNIIGTAAVAVYNPAIRIANLIEVPTMSLSTILFPKIGERLKNDGIDGAKRLYERAVGLILGAMLPVLAGIIIFAQWIVYILAGPGYEETVGIVHVTVFYTFFVPFSRFFGNLLDGTNKPHINFYVMVSLLFFNIIFNYVFIQWLGTIGAAYGTLCTLVTGFVIIQLYLSKHYGVKWYNSFKYIVEFYKEGYTFLRKKIKK